MKRLFILGCVTLLGLTAIHAASVVQYECDFENATQNKTWVLNPGNPMQNQWFIGGAVCNGGKNSLYITDSLGVRNAYQPNPGRVCAYTNLTLDAGEYELTLDWRCVGFTSGNVDGLYVAWVPEHDDQGIYTDKQLATVLNSTSSYDMKNGTLPAFTIYPDQEDKRLSGSIIWKQAAFKIESDGKPHKLALIWVNSSAVTNPPAAVDNILIQAKSLACPTPYNFSDSLDNGNYTLRWSGESNFYRITYKNQELPYWQQLAVTDTTYTFLNMSEGLWNFYVQGFCINEKGDTLRSRSVVVARFIYFPERHCVNYFDLSSKNCYWGTGFNSTYTPPTYVHQYDNFGYQSENSHHTIHYYKGETDARTNGKLQTIPSGELASVRIGNWLQGNQSSRIEYKFTVDSLHSSVLMLKYAAVLQSGGHEDAVQPRFTLEVLGVDEEDKECARADFNTNQAIADGWHGPCTWNNGGTEVKEIYWKDWTTVGVNLKKYHGRELTVRLTSFSCAQTAHFGYAYFTLGCSDGKLDGINCGATPTEYFIAPEGFKYRWYRKDNPWTESDPSTFLSSKQRYDLTSNRDTFTYCVDMLYPADTTCFFTLSASAMPRYPVANLNPKWTPTNCQNIYQFENLSEVITINMISQDTLRQKGADSYEWDFGDGSEPTSEDSPIHQYPDTGGVYNITLTTHYSTCDSTIVYPISVPRIGSVHMDTVRFSPAYDGQPTVIGNRTVNKRGLYVDTLQTFTGCDSIIALKYVVELAANFDKVIACADQPADFGYTVTRGGTTGYKIIFEDSVAMPNAYYRGNMASPIEYNMPADVVPNYYPYKIVLLDSLSDISEDAVVYRDTMIVQYAASTITQRWNDVLGITNKDYNGGYEFTAYQWFKNGILLEGETGSNLQLKNNEKFDSSDEYTALVTRNDGVKLFICSVNPDKLDEDDTPYLADPKDLEFAKKVVVRGRLFIQKDGKLFDVVGRVVE